MKKELLDLMKLQGEIKIKFLQKGIPEYIAHDLSSEALNLFAESDAMNKDHRALYAAFSHGNFET